MNNYAHFVVSIIHPCCEMTINRYCLGVSMDDPRMKNFNVDHWAEINNRNTLLSLLCEDWLTEGCMVVNCEEISGAVQWEPFK